jgi:hypothetical protein
LRKSLLIWLRDSCVLTQKKTSFTSGCWTMSQVFMAAAAGLATAYAAVEASAAAMQLCQQRQQQQLSAAMQLCQQRQQQQLS